MWHVYVLQSQSKLLEKGNERIIFVIEEKWVVEETELSPNRSSYFYGMQRCPCTNSNSGIVQVDKTVTLSFCSLKYGIHNRVIASWECLWISCWIASLERTVVHMQQLQRWRETLYSIVSCVSWQLWCFPGSVPLWPLPGHWQLCWQRLDQIKFENIGRNVVYHSLGKWEEESKVQDWLVGWQTRRDGRLWIWH